MSLPLKHTFSAIIAGPSRAGKTTWVAKLLRYRNQMISPTPDKIYFCYSEDQHHYQSDDFLGVEFVRGVVDPELLDSNKNNLIIFDDQMGEADSVVEKFFTKYSHHKNASVIYIVQNLFQKGSHMRTMSLNASYLVLFKNPRDINQISYLSRQMYPSSQSNFLEEAFRDATSSPYSYLMIDLRQETEELLRVRGGVFPDENTYIYMPRRATLTLHRYNLAEQDHE